MSAPSEFLTAFAQAISTMTLYEEGHPARERAIDRVHEKLDELQETGERAEFTFLGDEIVFDGVPLREMKTWGWGGRLAAAGIQRVEFTGPVSREDLDVFLEEILGLLSGQPGDTAERRQTRPTHIRYGVVELKGASGGSVAPADLETVTLSYSLRDEAQTVEWIHEELTGGRELPLMEAEVVVRSLAVAMHGDRQFLIPLLRLKEFDQYTTTHALNVSVLSMALAEFVGLAPKEVRTFGIAGLLHDLGKVRIPTEILNKPGKLTESEREVMNRHTVEGARIILETEEDLDLAAIVAYEHHIKLNGTGYPSLARPRPCHQASNLVHVCDVYDALRTNRPYREAWAHERVLEYMAEGTGEFDPHFADAFVEMMNRWHHRIAVVEDSDQPLPIGNGEAPEVPLPGGDTPEGGS